MKQAYALLLSFILLSHVASATNKFWVGPVNGKWSNTANWSYVSGGTGGAGTPGNIDDINFTSSASIIVDTNTVVHSIYTNFNSGKVVLIANINSSVFITGALNIGYGSSIKDSTAANVSFDVTFIKGSSASIQGDWIFEGGTPVTCNNGASFTAPLGTFVHITKSPIGFSGGRIICNKNSKPITSINTTLNFDYSSYFISDNILNAVIPNATWAKDSIKGPNTYDGILAAPASTILLTGNLLSVHHSSGALNYGKMVVNLATLSKDVSLSLPDGCNVRGNLEVQSTNGFNLALLSPESVNSNVTVTIGTTDVGSSFGGYLLIDGNSDVTIANASANAPANNFKLVVNKSFKQSGGNFSLQNYDGATGASTLDIKNDLIETGGTFVTLSTSINPTAQFRVIMDDPKFSVGPSGNFSSSRIISMSNGSIDNGRNVVILRIDHTVYNLPGYITNPNGVILQTPLKVGKLELVRSPLTTTSANILTVSNPSANAVTVTPGSGKNYVNGPMIRATNSTNVYSFPVGKGNTAQYDGFVFDSCHITPGNRLGSMYKVEYHNTPVLIVPVMAPLKKINPIKYWTIDRINGAEAKITLFLHAALDGASSYDGIVVASSTGGSWAKANGSMLTPGNVSTGAVTSKLMDTFGYFTFGYGTASNLPVKGIGIDLNDKNYDPTSISSAKTMLVEMKSATIYPNPFVDNFTMEFYNPGVGTANATMNLYDLKGSLVFSQKISNLVSGPNTVRVNVSGRNIPAANYVAQLKVNGIVAGTVKLMKK